ncbi:hypothetical protein REJC140_03852 [Pseudorhizobium endolithicum]|uniref:Uncharacterized protein n=1 Tax=Pseudorhizobium endolithicum TaxID=1191678 RepID=A0ABN7JUQ6_9HYPH|nr:hypothetical protein [Pseudorhizobium endolithicum]CAD7044677.1 hypothetical protein REJC140_03852 [Pseudorhizobium endolithicum]
MAWGERDFVSGFFEAFIAVILQWGGIAASFGGAFWAGTSVFRRTERHLLAWPAGILIFAAVALSFQEIGASIPGVGWRLEAMQDSSCYTDWDGRSNPTVCE